MVWQIGQLEFILDCLVDEKDRFAHKSRDATGENALATDVIGGSAVPLKASTTNGISHGDSQLSLEISVSRPAEIEAALQQFISPKVRSLWHHKSHRSLDVRSLGDVLTPLLGTTLSRQRCGSPNS